MSELPDLTLHEALSRVEAMNDVSGRRPAVADTRDGRVYVTTPDVVRAVKVALVTGRPLLVGGPPGTGKSSLASYVARNLGVAYYEFVAVDDSRPADLLWTIDAVRRLADAQAQRLRDEDDLDHFARYLQPGPFWWALDRGSAARRGLDPQGFARSELDEFSDPAVPLDEAPTSRGAVILIDEVDKADNAFSNGLLVPLGARQFDVHPIGRRIASDNEWSPLVIITTNNERDLSAAFLRRCVMLTLPVPDAERLVSIAERHFGEGALTSTLSAAVRELASAVVAESDEVSAAEFLDLVRVLAQSQDFNVASEEWQLIRRLVLDKQPLARRRAL